PQWLGAQGWITVIELNRRGFCRSYGESMLPFLEKTEEISRFLGVLQANSWQFTFKSAKMGAAKPA
ncbi:MAG: hypothetical protein RR085_12545, partial [Clostridia bacterium]